MGAHSRRSRTGPGQAQPSADTGLSVGVQPVWFRHAEVASDGNIEGSQRCDEPTCWRGVGYLSARGSWPSTCWPLTGHAWWRTSRAASCTSMLVTMTRHSKATHRSSWAVTMECRPAALGSSRYASDRALSRRVARVKSMQRSSNWSRSRELRASLERIRSTTIAGNRPTNHCTYHDQENRRRHAGTRPLYHLPSLAHLDNSADHAPSGSRPAGSGGAHRTTRPSARSRPLLTGALDWLTPGCGPGR